MLRSSPFPCRRWSIPPTAQHSQFSRERQWVSFSPSILSFSVSRTGLDEWAERRESPISLSLFLWHLLRQTSSAWCWSLLIRPAAPLSVALLQFSPLGGKRNFQGPFHLESPLPLSQSLSRLCLRTRRKRMMKRSLRRNYWRWDVTAGCSALRRVSLLEETNKKAQSGSCAELTAE